MGDRIEHTPTSIGGDAVGRMQRDYNACPEEVRHPSDDLVEKRYRLSDGRLLRVDGIRDGTDWFARVDYSIITDSAATPLSCGIAAWWRKMAGATRVED